MTYRYTTIEKQRSRSHIYARFHNLFSLFLPAVVPDEFEHQIHLFESLEKFLPALFSFDHILFLPDSTIDLRIHLKFLLFFLKLFQYQHCMLHTAFLKYHIPLFYDTIHLFYPAVSQAQIHLCLLLLSRHQSSLLLPVSKLLPLLDLPVLFQFLSAFLIFFLLQQNMQHNACH